MRTKGHLDPRRPHRRAASRVAKERILVLDGAWGVMIQRANLSEEDFRGERFAAHVTQMKGNNDILCLTRPDIVAGLHDPITPPGPTSPRPTPSRPRSSPRTTTGWTNSRSGTSIFEGARLARAAADRWTEKEPHKPRFVAGSIGPLNKMLSMSSDVNDPGARW
jgi:5-methyltetrahydrofolate--homocysteine methyltransferase